MISDAQPQGHDAGSAAETSAKVESPVLRPLDVKPVAIVGGGIGGLALGVGLKRQGIPTVVFERDESIAARPQGYSLTIQQGIHALDDLGVGEKIRAFGEDAVTAAYETLDKKGNTLMCFAAKKKLKKKNKNKVVVPITGQLQASVAPARASSLSPPSRRSRSPQSDRRNTNYSSSRSPPSRSPPSRSPPSRSPVRSPSTSPATSPRSHPSNSSIDSSDSSSSGSLTSFLANRTSSNTTSNTANSSPPLSAAPGVHHRRRKGHNIPVPRQSLRQILLDEYLKEEPNSAPVSVTWSCNVIKVQEDADGISIVYSTPKGETVSEKMTAVVACDGVRSVLRDQLLSDKLKYLGVMAIMGICEVVDDDNQSTAQVIEGHPSLNDPRGFELVRDRVFQSIDGEGNRIFGKPFDETHAMWQLTFPINEEEVKRWVAKWRETGEGTVNNAGAQTLKDEAARRVEGFHPPIPRMVHSTPLERIRASGIYDRDPIEPQDIAKQLEQHGLSRVTFLGDAAHPMSPFKGQGANQALEDAVDLAKSLAELLRSKHDASKDEVASLLRNYEDRMLKRTAPKVLGSRSNVEFLHTADAVDKEKLYDHAGLTPERRAEMQSVIEIVTKERQKLQNPSSA